MILFLLSNRLSLMWFGIRYDCVCDFVGGGYGGGNCVGDCRALYFVYDSMYFELTRYDGVFVRFDDEACAVVCFGFGWWHGSCCIDWRDGYGAGGVDCGDWIVDAVWGIV